MDSEALIVTDNDDNVLLSMTGEVTRVDANHLWSELLRLRPLIKTIAHSHPGGGQPAASIEDITTFFGMNLSGFRHVEWVIMTRDRTGWFKPNGAWQYSIYTRDIIANRPWAAQLWRMSYEQHKVT